MSSYVVLLSAGMDSTLNLHRALQEGTVRLALTFNYGQRAFAKEAQKAAEMCRQLSVPHQIVEVPFFKDFGHSSLVDLARSVPVGEEVKIADFRQSQKTAKSVWVPNRNGVLLNIAAGYAESLDVPFIVPGFNREEASTFPDNSADFISATEKALAFSTSNQVRIQCWTIGMDKTEIVREGNRLKVDWKMIWPCYFSAEKWCGRCESCLRAKRAFAAVGVSVNANFEI
jgi:7-cyano-7-deazaguanine synthase